MIQYFIVRGEDPRQIYATIPAVGNTFRPVYITDASTALAWRNGAALAEFSFDDAEYVVTRPNRAVMQVVQAQVKPKA